jgi:hypothetical protein
MRTNEEKVIRRLKRRNTKIICYAILVVLLSAALGFFWLQMVKIDERVTSERVRAMASFENLKSELPILFTYFQTLARVRAELIIDTHLVSGLLGFFLASLIIELIGQTKDAVIVSMWERIQSLEKELNNVSKENGLQHPGGDAKNPPASGTLHL